MRFRAGSDEKRNFPEIARNRRKPDRKPRTDRSEPLSGVHARCEKWKASFRPFVERAQIQHDAVFCNV